MPANTTQNYPRNPGTSGGTHVVGELLHTVLLRRTEEEHKLNALLWEAGPQWRMAASSVLGGGIGPRSFVLNAQVADGYQRMDPDIHLREIATAAGVRGEGVGLMTAANVTQFGFATVGGVEALVTAAIGRPIWAADTPELDEARIAPAPEFQGPGTINIIVAVPSALCDAALTNAIATATEAKVQAVMQTGYACTGTASDAVCVAGRAHDRVIASTSPAAFGGPRSRWGARIARAVYRAVVEGIFRGDPART